MREKIFRFTYHYYLKLIGRDVVSYAKSHNKTQYFSPSEIKSLQLKKLKNVLINAYENVPFYTSTFKRIGFDPYNLSSLDEFNALDFYVTKDDIKASPESFISKLIDKNDLSWHRTGGSTGTPLLFATDKLTDAGSQASIMRGLNWFGTSFGRKHVIFWASPTFVVRTPLDNFKKYFTKLRNFLMNRVFISNYDLNPNNMLGYFHVLERFKPEYIRGMASSLYVFSKFIIDNDLKFVHCKPKVIHSACEQLFDWQKEVIEQAFGVRVANTYGLSELADIGYGAECGHIHVSDEDVYLELIPFNSNDKEIVATQLNNMSCPLIKYKTADIAESLETDDACGIGLQYINGLKGRAHDFIVGVDGKFIHGQFFTHLLVFESGVDKYQIVQETINLVIVKLVVSDQFKLEKTERLLTTNIKKFLGDSVSISFEYPELIPLTAGGKHRWIISKVER